MSIDCEMDLNTEEMTPEQIQEVMDGVFKGNSNPGHCLKISLVNQNREIVLDTLVDFTSERLAKVVKFSHSDDSTEP